MLRVWPPQLCFSPPPHPSVLPRLATQGLPNGAGFWAASGGCDGCTQAMARVKGQETGLAEGHSDNLSQELVQREP